MLFTSGESARMEPGDPTHLHGNLGPGQVHLPSAMERIEALLRENLGAHPYDLVEHVARLLSLDTEKVAERVRSLIQRGVFVDRQIDGRSHLDWRPILVAPVHAGLAEDKVWRETVAPRLRDTPRNVVELLAYGFTEMVNNVVDHSGAKKLVVLLKELPDSIELHIQDDGVGIFEKLQRELGLEDPRHVALELAKGKLTTDPTRHTGEGIFFTARMCDTFLIWSETTACGHVDDGPWVVMTYSDRPGTTIRMIVRLDSKRTPRTVFDEFAPPGQDLPVFSKTALSADLMRHPGESLVSRSQAKRLLARCESFREVTLDFKGVDSIGPAFADEVFRVFPSLHPAVAIHHENANEAVLRMIERARKNGETGSGRSP